MAIACSPYYNYVWSFEISIFISRTRTHFCHLPRRSCYNEYCPSMVYSVLLDDTDRGIGQSGDKFFPVRPVTHLLFHILFFFNGFQFVIMETVITAIVDEFRINRWRHGKLAVTGFFCLAFFLLGLPQCTRVSSKENHGQIFPHQLPYYNVFNLCSPGWYLCG